MFDGMTSLLPLWHLKSNHRYAVSVYMITRFLYVPFHVFLLVYLQCFGCSTVCYCNITYVFFSIFPFHQILRLLTSRKPVLTLFANEKNFLFSNIVYCSFLQSCTRLQLSTLAPLMDVAQPIALLFLNWIQVSNQNFHPHMEGHLLMKWCVHMISEGFSLSELLSVRNISFSKNNHTSTSTVCF